MKILVAGDFLPCERVADLFDKKQYERVFGQIRDYNKEVDYSIVNFECPISSVDLQPLKKCGPSLKCSESAIGALQFAGFRCVTLANNHFRDFGDDGCLNTLKVFDEHNVDYVGGGKNLSESANILYRVFDGKRLAIINCCEHEFSIATENKPGSNPLNPIKQYYTIKEAHREADYVLVIVHGGHEHYQLPSPRMQETYRFFIDAGADAVINHHQHCYSGYEVYKGKPIFYGIGNFCFDKPAKKNSMWNEGYMVVLNFEDKGENTYRLLPYQQCNEEPTIVPMTGEIEFLFQKRIAELNAIISIPNELNEHFKQWCRGKIGQKETLFSPYYGSIFEKMRLKGLIPTINTDKRMLDLYDHISCEAHRDTTLYYLNSSL